MVENTWSSVGWSIEFGVDFTANILGEKLI